MAQRGDSAEWAFYRTAAEGRKKTAWRRPHKAENPLKAGFLLCSL